MSVGFAGFVSQIPKFLWNLFVFQLIKDTVWAHHNEIMFIRINCKIGNFGFSYKNTWISSILRLFGLDISKRPWYWQFSRFDSEGAKNCIAVFLDTALVNVAASLKNSVFFSWWFWLMIARDLENLFTRFCAQNGSTISDISDITDLVNNQENQGATATFLNRVSALSKFQKLSFGVLKPFFKGLNWLMGKILIFSDLG